MKASEAKPLAPDELTTLKLLLQRWILCEFPFYGGSSEESDAMTTYEMICNGSEYIPDKEWIAEMTAKFGEQKLD